MSQESQKKCTWISAGAELPIPIPRFDYRDYSLPEYVEEYARGVGRICSTLTFKEDKIELELELLLRELFREYKKNKLFYLSRRAKRRNRHKIDYLAWKASVSSCELEDLRKKAEEIINRPSIGLLSGLSLLLRTQYPNSVD